MGISQIDVILPYWSWKDAQLLEGVCITALSTVLLTMTALMARYYIRNEIVKILLLCSILFGFYVLIVLNIINNVFAIWGLFLGLFIASFIIIKTMEKTHSKIASLASGLNLDKTHDVVDLNTYLDRVAKFKYPKRSSLLGIECFGYTIKVQDYLTLIPVLYRYLNNSDLSTQNEISALKAEAMQRDLSNPFNKDYVQLLNYILISKNFLWEFESKWLQLKSRSEILKNTPRVHKKFFFFKKSELKQPLKSVSSTEPMVFDNKDDSASAKASSFDVRENNKDSSKEEQTSLKKSNEKYGTVDHALLFHFIENIGDKEKEENYESKANDLLNFSLKKNPDLDLNPDPNLTLKDQDQDGYNIVKAVNNYDNDEAQFHEVHIMPTPEQVNHHEQQAKLLQQQIGIRPSLVGELYFGDDSLKLAEQFNFDKSFELYFRRYYKDMSLRVFAFFQFLTHTSKTKAQSAHHINRVTKGFTSREVGVSSLSVNGALYLSAMPISIDLLQPIIFMVFMSGSTYLFLNKLTLSAFISYNGGYGSAISMLQGMHWWAIAFTVIIGANSLNAVISCFKKTLLRLSSQTAFLLRTLKVIVAAITLAISATILWPGQLLTTIEMIHSDLEQINRNELSTTSGYVNNRLFNERIVKGVLPKVYDVLAIPVIGPRTGNKWIKLYLPVDQDLVISPHERLQVANRFSKDKRLHTKNVPRWMFKHTRNFKLIVSAKKVDSTFIKKASLGNKQSINPKVNM